MFERDVQPGDDIVDKIFESGIGSSDLCDFRAFPWERQSALGKRGAERKRCRETKTADPADPDPY